MAQEGKGREGEGREERRLKFSEARDDFSSLFSEEKPDAKTSDCWRCHRQSFHSSSSRSSMAREAGGAWRREESPAAAAAAATAARERERGSQLMHPEEGGRQEQEHECRMMGRKMGRKWNHN